MTDTEKLNLEFSNEFDVLYNNITSNQAPGLDEYEKSVFLTRAQDEIVKAYFNPKLNKSMEGFDGNEKRQIDFSMIIKSEQQQRQTSTSNAGVQVTFNPFQDGIFDQRKETGSVTLPEDILMFINEYVVVNRNDNSVRLNVLPITYTEYSRIMSKPYKRPLKFQCWRLLDNTNGSRRAELIVGPNDRIDQYVYRYIKRPCAIRLTDFDDEVTLDGDSTAQACELDPILYPEIIQRAAELAKAAYVGDLNTQIALGTNSQTNVGMLTSSK